MTDTLAPLHHFESTFDGVDHDEHHEPIKKTRRSSSSISGVFSIKDLEFTHTELTLPIETQKTGWKINTSPSSIEDPSILSMLLVQPPVKKIDLHFPLGKEVHARNMKGVTIKDAMDAIYKAYKKKTDDELELPYLKGFEWDKDECWSRLIVHLQKNQGPTTFGSASKNSKKSKKDKKAEESV